MREILDDYVKTSFDGAQDYPLKYRHFEHNYRKWFPRSRAAPVLDIGVGRGEMLELMRRWGYQQYHGIDISPSTVAHCQDRGLSCEHVEDCADWLRSHRQRFAVITLLDVIEHLDRDAVVPLLRAAHDALVPTGKLIVQTPNLQAPEAYLHRYQDITHQLGFGEHSMAQVASAAGFKRIDCFGFETMLFLGWGTPRTYVDGVRRMLRGAVFAGIRLLRAVVGNPNPRILHPVMSAVMERD